MKNHSFKGFEIVWNRFLMELKMQTWTVIILFLLHIFVFGQAVIFFTPDGTFAFAISYILRKSLFMPIDPETQRLALIAVGLLWKLLLYTSAVYLLYPLALLYFKRTAKKHGEVKHVRGAEIILAKELKRDIYKANVKTRLKIGNIDIPISAEIQHALVVGRPGAGKTVCLSSVLEKIQEANLKAVIYDTKGDYLSKFYNPDCDFIFNPLDVRSLRWNIFSEVQTKMDIETISTSLVPPGQSSDTEKFFADAARSVFSGILHYCYEQDDMSNARIWEIVNMPISEITEILKSQGSRGYIYIQDGAGKQAIGVHSTLMQYAAGFEYMTTGGDFSIRDWVQDEKGSCIFVTNYAEIRDTLRPILSLFVDLFSVRLLSQRDDLDRRIFVILDEFGTLQRLSSIVQLLTLSRSKGGSVWLGTQDIGQIDKVYQQPLRQAISNACATSVLLAAGDDTTAKFMSDRIGDREILETEESQSMGPEDLRDGISLSQRKKTEKAVLPSEFLNLSNLDCFLKVPNFRAVKTKLEYRKYEEKHEPIIIRSDLILKKKGV